MKINLLTTGLLAAAALTTARAQTAAPNSPAPSVVPQQNVMQAPALQAVPTQTVYTPRLPSPEELTNAAGAQGLTVERIEQSQTQVIATYRHANGQATTVAYQALPPSGSVGQQVTVQTAAPAVTYVATPPPRVVYVEDDYYRPAYYPYYYPPVSLHMGFGYRSGFGGHGFGGGYRGGFRHHR